MVTQFVNLKSRWYPILREDGHLNHSVLASALDPRFKQLEFLNDDLHGDVKTELLQRMENLPSIVTSMDECDCWALKIVRTRKLLPSLMSSKAMKIAKYHLGILVWWMYMYNYPKLVLLSVSFQRVD